MIGCYYNIPLIATLMKDGKQIFTPLMPYSKLTVFNLHKCTSLTGH